MASPFQRASWFVFGAALMTAASLSLTLLGSQSGLLEVNGERTQVATSSASSAVRARNAKVPRVIYLNREGARLTAGVDDASKNSSSLVKSARHPSVHFPAFEGSFSQWSGIVECVRDRFSAYGVAIQDQRPTEPGYLMVMVGGTAKQFEAANAIAGDHAENAERTGLSPFNGEVIPSAVVLVFAKTLNNAPRAVCETAGEEIGHAYGLDHAMNCHDLMTYLPQCGARRFDDKAVPCGEQHARACTRGGSHQNSYARLLEILGPRGG